MSDEQPRPVDIPLPEWEELTEAIANGQEHYARPDGRCWGDCPACRYGTNQPSTTETQEQR